MTLSEELIKTINRQIQIYDEVGNQIISGKQVVPDAADILVIYQEVNKDLRQQRIYAKKTTPEKGREYYCTRCGKKIEPRVAHYSQEKYGERLCRNCQPKTQ